MSNLDNSKFTNSFYVSAFLHIVALGFFYLGVPTFREPLPDQQEIFTFEMLPASAVPNVKNQQSQKKGRVEKKAKEIKQSKPSKTNNTTEKNKTPVSSKNTSKAPEKKVKTTKPIAKKESKTKQIEQKPKADTNKQKNKKHQNKKDEKKTAKQVTTKKNKDEENPIDTLLKNLEEASTGDTSKSPFRAVDVNELDNKKFSKGHVYDENSPLSITERLVIKRQIEANWQPPLGLEDLESMRILLYLKLNEDGSVSDLDIKNVVCPNSAIAICKIFAESVIRAVKQANPLENLLPERYDVWKEFELNFDPSQISQ